MMSQAEDKQNPATIYAAQSMQIETRVFTACADPSQLHQQPLKSEVGPAKLDLSFNDIASKSFYLEKKIKKIKNRRNIQCNGH